MSRLLPRRDDLAAEVDPLRVQRALLLDSLPDIASNPVAPAGGFVTALAAEYGVTVDALLAVAT